MPNPGADLDPEVARSPPSVDASPSGARRAAASYTDFPQYDRGLPNRATGRAAAVGMDPFRTHAASVLRTWGFQVLQDDPPQDFSGPFYRGPSGVQGLIIGERRLQFDAARRKQGNLVFAILIPLGILLILAAVVGVSFSDARFLYLVAGGGFSILGSLFLGQRRWSFDSEMLYVNYTVVPSETPLPRVRPGERPPATEGGLRLDLTVSAGEVVTQNVSTKLGTSRQLKASADGPPELRTLPAQFVRLLEGPPGP